MTIKDFQLGKLITTDINNKNIFGYISGLAKNSVNETIFLITLPTDYNFDNLMDVINLERQIPVHPGNCHEVI